MGALMYERAGKWRGMPQHLTQVIDGTKAHRLRCVVQQRELAVIQPDSRQIKTAIERQQLQLSHFATFGPFDQRLQIQGPLPAYQGRRSPLYAKKLPLSAGVKRSISDNNSRAARLAGLAAEAPRKGCDRAEMTVPG